jgi:inorganic phosphate transporter, PiT family
MIEAALFLLLGGAIAFANGSNDVSKGIATLAGSGVTNLRRAILWGTVWTGLGALAAAVVAKALVHTFATGLLAPGIHPTTVTALAVVCGAALWVAISTRQGLPVSTTHAIIGAVSGVAIIAFGPNAMNWSILVRSVALPLLLSPVAALALTALAVRVLYLLAPQSDCVCFEAAPAAVATETGAIATMPIVHLNTCTVSEQSSGVAGITFDHLHWLTSAATSFSRGLNDTPKMVALVLGGVLLSRVSPTAPLLVFLAIASGMVAGSWLAGRRVSDILARKVVRIDHREGFVANLITAALVGPGAALGLPMSTTHVASGAILGLSSRERKPNLSVVRDMILAWVVTLPGAAALAIGAFFLLRIAGVK